MMMGTCNFKYLILRLDLHTYFLLKISKSTVHYRGAHGSVVGSGIMLQARRLLVQVLRRSLDFSFDLIQLH
jgi:hypothetical protein